MTRFPSGYQTARKGKVPVRNDGPLHEGMRFVQEMRVAICVNKEALQKLLSNLRAQGAKASRESPRSRLACELFHHERM